MIQNNFAKTQSSITMQRWHKRLKHDNYTAIKKLTDGACTEIKVSGSRHVSDPCEGCVMGNMTRAYFSSRPKDSMANKALEIVYSDICGLFPVDALQSCARYYILLIDEYSLYILVYLIKRKSDAYDAVPKFVAEVRGLSGNSFLSQLVSFQTDNGVEYMSDQLKSYF
jgi:hypothetical protein